MSRDQPAWLTGLVSANQWRRFCMEGTVIFFNPVKCWGFIAADDGRRIFVHADDVRRMPDFGYRRFLVAGDRVSFDVVRAHDGRAKADNVVILQSSIRSESHQAYVERGRIFPRTDPRATFPDIRRPDGDSLYAYSDSVRTQGLDQ